jgi:hypothetical protein
MVNDVKYYDCVERNRTALAFESSRNPHKNPTSGVLILSGNFVFGFDWSVKISAMILIRKILMRQRIRRNLQPSCNQGG